MNKVSYRFAFVRSHRQHTVAGGKFPKAFHYRLESLDGSPVTTATAESMVHLLPDDAAAHVLSGHLVFNRFVLRDRCFTPPTIITSRKLTRSEATIHSF
jgi:hypothetical protein